MKKKKYPFTQNREVSWLKFNQRVLEEAADPDVPLLERLKFLAIFTSNLDEFFMVRAGSLMDMALVDDSQTDAKSGMKPSEQLEAIYEESRRLYAMRDNISKNLQKTLRAVQIVPVHWKNLNKKQLKAVNKVFETELKPLLAPQIIDLHHPFPFLINKELYIFFSITEDGKQKYGILPLPGYLPRIIYLNEEKTEYILTESILYHQLEKLFDKGKITFKTIIRVTRNADINLIASNIDEDEDYRQYMEKILKRRSRLSPIRLEIFKDTSEEAVKYLCSQLHISPQQVFVSRYSSLEPRYVFSLIDHLPEDLRRTLSYEPFSPATCERLNPDAPIIPQILDHDVLLSYPYNDIGEFIRLLKEASTSPDVVSIKITIYRLANDSQVVRWLVQAAENGKEVMVLMELRARFDEEHNIRAAEKLEEAGCNVIYGFDEYKVHSKLCQITLKGRSGLRTITQIGTGNYNEKTSHQYTDFSLITSNEAIGKDAAEFFRNMNISNLNGTYHELLVSPHALKKAILDGLDEQIRLAREGKPTRAWFKMNSLTDLDIIAKLSEASCAGVKIRLLVRGICCLLPGLPGLTENIEVHQIVGRYLEHARIYIFGTGENKRIYISSADFMTRNTERRVEVGAPVLDPELKKQLMDYFEKQWNDDRKGRRLLPSGYYTAIETTGDEPFSSQDYFMEQAWEHRYVPREQPRTGLLEKVRHFFSRR